MKKKGLLIATIVMVLVLAVSLTTATYAWFTASAATSIEGFNLSVTAGNVMNIGLNGTGLYDYNPDATPDSFVSGNVMYTPDPTDGHFAKGYWTGEVASLSDSIQHTIVWGEQEKAVGFCTLEASKTDATAATFATTKFMSNDYQSVIKGSGDKISLNGQAHAIANGGYEEESKTVQGDYLYLFLGAQPTKYMKAETNKLYIVVQSQGSGTTIGMAAAIHVAVKLNGQQITDPSESGWEDIDVFGAKKYSDAKSGLADVVVWGDYSKDTNVTGTYDASTKKTTFENAAVVEITLSEYFDASDPLPLDQIQLLIYIAGADEDCNDMSKTGDIGIGIFFGAQEAETASPTP